MMWQCRLPVCLQFYVSTVCTEEAYDVTYDLSLIHIFLTSLLILHFNTLYFAFFVVLSRAHDHTLEYAHELP